MKRFKVPLVATATLLFCLWLIQRALAVELPSIKNPLLFYSNQTRQDLKALVAASFRAAKSSIEVTSYSLTDQELLSLLSRRAHEEVSVSLYYDPKASAHFMKNLEPMQVYPIRMSGLMHRKITLIDREIVFIGTANLTSTSLSMHDNMMIGLYHPGLAQFLAQSDAGHYSFSIEQTQGEVWLLPDPSGEALTRLMETIDQAQSSLHLSMFTLTHPDLIEALIRAHRRGVEVRVAVDGYTAKGAGAVSCERLAQSGIQVYISQGIKLLHHKWILIDAKTFILGSANWTRAAFSKNRDVYLLLSPLSKEQATPVLNVWNIIEVESKSAIN